MRSTSCHRFTLEGIVSLRGAVLTTITANGPTTHTITHADAYVATLEHQFALHLPQAAALWPQIWVRHQQWLSEQYVLTLPSALNREAEQG